MTHFSVRNSDVISEHGGPVLHDWKGESGWGHNYHRREELEDKKVKNFVQHLVDELQIGGWNGEKL